MGVWLRYTPFSATIVYNVDMVVLLFGNKINDKKFRVFQFIWSTYIILIFSLDTNYFFYIALHDAEMLKFKVSFIVFVVINHTLFFKFVDERKTAY